MSIDRVLAIGGIVIGVVGAIVGLGAAWYFYRASLPTRIPTFLVNPVRTVLVAGGSSATSDITIQYKGQAIRQKAVNVVRVFFWNAGNTPITHADIRESLTIIISPDSEILEAKILKVSRHLTLITFDVQENQRDTANVDFDLLESNDGAALQITYVGPSDAKLAFHGATIGAPEVSEKKVPDYSRQILNSLSPLEKVITRYRNVVASLFLGLVLSVLLAMTMPSNRNKLLRSNKAVLLLYSAMSALTLLGFVLNGAIPPEVSEVIPSALIFKD